MEWGIALISVIMSVYNMEIYLRCSIESVLSQTYKDFELLLIDDGSTDESGKICDVYEKRDDRISVFHKKNGGLSSARNYGIDHAKGDYVIFPDPDDWVETDYLERLLEYRKIYVADLSICGYSWFHGKHNTQIGCVVNTFSMKQKTCAEKATLRTASTKKDRDMNEAIIMGRREALEKLMHPYMFCGFAWNKLYDMNMIREHALRFDEELGLAQDLHFAFQYILLCNRVVYHPKPLYHYRPGGATDMAKPLTRRKMSGFRTYEKIAEIAENSSYSEIKRAAYRSLFDLCLRNIYAYYHGRKNLDSMDDPSVLTTLRETLKLYRNYYFPNDVYSIQHDLAARLALLSPRMYYIIIFLKRLIKGQDHLHFQRQKTSNDNP